MDAIKESQTSPTIITNTQITFILISRGKEKQASEMFPMEYHLMQKYSLGDLNSIYKLLSIKIELAPARH